MGILKAVGQAGADPGNGLDVRRAGECPATGPLAGELDRQALLRLVECLDQMLAAPPGRGTIAQQLE